MLKAELSKANEKTLDIWQENCEQLIKYDNALIERDREVQQLMEQLQVRKLELRSQTETYIGGAELPEEATIRDSTGMLNSRSSSVYTGTMSTCVPRDSDILCFHLNTLRWLTSDHSRGHVFTPTRITTTTPDFRPLKHLAAITSTDNVPLQCVNTPCHPFCQETVIQHC